MLLFENICQVNLAQYGTFEQFVLYGAVAIEALERINKHKVVRITKQLISLFTTLRTQELDHHGLNRRD